MTTKEKVSRLIEFKDKTSGLIFNPKENNYPTYNDINIGIYGNSDKSSIFTDINIVQFASFFGNPVIIPDMFGSIEKVCQMLDVLIIPGGADVNPKRYGHKPHPKTTNSNDVYERLDETLASYMMSQGKAVFGICRGFQTINVILGGTLIQELNDNNHRYDHQIAVDKNYDYDKYNDNFLYHTKTVNSRHHQGIGLTNLASSLKAIAFDTIVQNKAIKTGEIVEAFIHRTLPVAGVQWHPEDIHDPTALYLLANIIESYLSNKI